MTAMLIFLIRKIAYKMMLFFAPLVTLPIIYQAIWNMYQGRLKMRYTMHFLTHNNPLSNRFREVEIFRPRQQKFKYAFFNPKKTLLSNLQEFYVKPWKWSAPCEWNGSRLQALKNAMKHLEEIWSNVKHLEVTESNVK